MPDASAPGPPDHPDLSDTIDRLSEALSQARKLPNWGVDIAVVAALVSFIVLLHLMAFAMFGPCVWLMYKRREREREAQAIPSAEDPDEFEEALQAAEDLDR
jgi:hypothetical protein